MITSPAFSFVFQHLFMSFRKSAFAQGETVSQSRVIKSNHQELNSKIKTKHYFKERKKYVYLNF